MNNRILKFRIWDLAIGEWGIEDYLECSGPELKYFLEEDPKNYVIQQFTGLLDKNNKEIYEGDLVINPEDNLLNYYEIVWNQQAAKFNTVVHVMHHKLCPSKPIPMDNMNKMELVGNIYENSDLLKK